jgi:hypothetical protein
VTKLPRPPAAEAKWSEDGQRLIFSGGGDIWTVNADGTGLQPITRTVQHEERPLWARGERAVYYVGIAQGSPQVWRTELIAGMPAIQITTGGAHDFALDSQGKTLYFTKYRDRPTGLWKVSATGGPETFVLEGVRGGCWTLKDDAVYFLDFRDSPLMRYLPRDVMRFDLAAGGTPKKVGTLPAPLRSSDRNLLIGFDYGPRTGRFYWSQRDMNLEDIMWIENFR